VARSGERDLRENVHKTSPIIDHLALASPLVPSTNHAPRPYYWTHALGSLALVADFVKLEPSSKRI
jgi:hypothetical protein